MADWRSYDGVAEDYERVRAPVTTIPAGDLVALADPPEGGRVLDIGTGTGVAAEAASRAVGAGGLAVGVDASQGMLGVARARPGPAFVAAEAIQLPFRDASFDRVVANFVLQEFTRHDTALFDLIRVLRPGSTLAASLWAASDDELSRTWRALAVEAVGEDLIRAARKDAAPWSELFSTPAGIEGALRDAGLRPVRIERKTYRFRMAREEYVVEHATRWMGRFVRQMLGERAWPSFLDRARRSFAERFPEHIEDSREVLFAIGTKS